MFSANSSWLWPNRISRNLTSVLFTLVSIMCCSTTFAGGAGENVVVVVNADSASSKLIANHYIAERKIPSKNVIYLSGIPNRETLKLATFKAKILKPIFHELEIRNIQKSVDYIVYSADFPTAINVTEHYQALMKQAKDQGQNLPAKVFTAVASITSLTYYGGAVLSDQPGYMMLDSNNYFRGPAEIMLTRPFVGKRQEEFVEATSGVDANTAPAELEKSIKTLTEMFKRNPQQTALAYWLARMFAFKGDKKRAAQLLVISIQLGWEYRSYSESDPAFSKLKEDPGFANLLKRIPDEPFEFAPTRGFKSRYPWAPNGAVNLERGQGNPHFISAVLAVTRNHGTSEKEALRQIKRSVRADDTFPDGKVYFTDTSDVRVKTRKPFYDKTIAALERLGIESVVVKEKIPVKVRDVIGLTCGTSSFNWTQSGSKLVPGAFCDNLTSYGGMLYKAGQTKVSEFIRFGAAGASGTVVEPYAIAQKFPHPRVHVHYIKGCSLGEAYYQSVSGPFQLLLVGDPLCQPWAVRPQLKVNGIKAGDVVKGNVPLAFDASASQVPVAGFELYVDGVVVHRTAMKPKLNFDTTGMTDGYHEIRVVATASSAIETTSSQVIPILVNNFDKSTTLTTEFEDYLDTDKVLFKAKSNYGDSIELIHNGRSIDKKIGRDAEFEIEAAMLGRGPVQLEAVAISEDSGKSVASMPVTLEINGRLKELKEDTETKKKPAPKK